MSEITDSDVFARFPNDRIDRDNIPFFRGLLERRLVVGRCHDCGRWNQPLWPNCPACWSDDVRPTEVSGKGRVHTFTLLHAGMPWPGIDYAAGYPLAVVELEEQDGLRAVATIVNCPNDDIRIGMPVELTWLEREGHPIPAFQPAE